MVHRSRRQHYNLMTYDGAALFTDSTLPAHIRRLWPVQEPSSDTSAAVAESIVKAHDEGCSGECLRESLMCGASDADAGLPCNCADVPENYVGSDLKAGSSSAMQSEQECGGGPVLEPACKRQRGQ